MLTPYEFGRENGQLQARINHEEVSEERIKQLAELLAYKANEITEFAEGYRNGFAEAKAEPDEDVPPWLPSAAELDEIEEGLAYPPYHCDCPGDCNH